MLEEESLTGCCGGGCWHWGWHAVMRCCVLFVFAKWYAAVGGWMVCWQRVQVAAGIGFLV